ncbi:MAG: alanine racemase [Anaeromyxobacteraceae bacterium]
MGAKRILKRLLTPAARALARGASPLPPATWGLEVTAGGRLSLAGQPLSELRARFGSPLFVVLGDRLAANARAWLAADRPGLRPDVHVSYKTNPVPGVLARLHAAGLGAEVISAYELWLARRLGVPPDRITFNGPVKAPDALRDAIAAGVLLNVNHPEELPEVAAAARAAGRRARVGVRVATTRGWSAQFGAPIAGGAALRALRAAQGSPDLEVVALHAHPGGMQRTREDALQHAREVLALADEARAALGLEPGTLDLGGSLATPTVAPLGALARRLNSALDLDHPPPDPAATLSPRGWVDALLGEVEAHHRRLGRPAPRIVLEPGRALFGDAQLLLASVHAVKDPAAERPWVILDAGINLAECVRGEFHQLYAADRMAEAPGGPQSLVGPMSSPGDLLRASVRLPRLSPGDALAVMDAGAYFVPFASSFSFPRPAIVIVEGGEAALLRRAETFEDLVALDVAEAGTG